MKRNHFRKQFSSYATMDLDGGNLETILPAVETDCSPAVMVIQMNHFRSLVN